MSHLKEAMYYYDALMNAKSKVDTEEVKRIATCQDFFIGLQIEYDELKFRSLGIARLPMIGDDGIRYYITQINFNDKSHPIPLVITVSPDTDQAPSMITIYVPKGVDTPYVFLRSLCKRQWDSAQMEAYGYPRALMKHRVRVLGRTYSVAKNMDELRRMKAESLVGSVNIDQSVKFPVLVDCVVDKHFEFYAIDDVRAIIEAL